MYDFSRTNELKSKEYFRTDLRLGFRLDRNRVAQEFAIDLQNLFNTRNHMGYTYNQETGEYAPVDLQRFTPMVTYRINYSF